jgi:hypothetical protein
MDVNKLILNHSLNVPEEERQKIYDIAWVVNFRTSPNEADLRYLFSIWNSYLSRGDTEDINCRGCRAKVVSKLRKMSWLWKENGLLATTTGSE